MEDNSSESFDKEVEEFSNVSLRPFDLSDVDDLMVWATDDKVTRFCLWDTYTSKEDAITYIKDIAIPHPWLRAICLNGRPIGSISVSENSGFSKCRGEVGYVLAAKYWGKGIVTRALKMVVDTIFREWPHLERLEALVHVENVASQKVLQKVGFKKEGVLRKYVILKGKAVDVFMFSLLSTDPRT